MARAAATNTGYPDVEQRGNSIRVFFMFMRTRHSHTLRLEPTRNNIKHAVQLRSAALFALRNGSYNEADFFPHSRSAASETPGGTRLAELCERYKPLKAVNITPETQSRYEVALNMCVDTLGPDRLVSALLPEDIQQLRVLLSPKTQARRKAVNDYFVPSAWNTKWANLIRRTEIRARPQNMAQITPELYREALA